MTLSTKITRITINQWLKDHLQESEVKVKLVSMGYDEMSIEENLKEFKKVKYAKRQNLGFVLVGLGAFIGFVSCVLTMLDIFPELNNFFLYGLTTCAVSLVFWGLYNIFE